MSQQSIIAYLKKHKGKKFTTRDLAKKLKVNITSVNTSAMKLRENKENGIDKSLMFKLVPRPQGPPFFQYWWKNS